MKISVNLRGRTYGWTDIFPLYIIRSTLGTLTLFTDERRLYLVLSIAAAHAAQCFLQKN